MRLQNLEEQWVCKIISRFSNLLKASTENTINRLKRFKFPISVMNLGLDLGKDKFVINLKKNSIKKVHFKKNNILILKTSKRIISSILLKKIHMNNATIGCFLNWERYPNNYLKFRKLYDNLNFFHV